MTPNNKKNQKDIKKAEFKADFESIERIVKIMHQKKL
jgi:hypothetical protein